jgi:predicted RNA polymerase sigma factor
MDFEKLDLEESGRILSTLIRLFGDFDLAEEMLQEPYAAALQKWPCGKTAANPRTCLITTARHKPIDRFRRARCFESKQDELAKYIELTGQSGVGPESSLMNAMFPDDRLRLIFTCYQPALCHGRASRAHASHHLRLGHRGNLTCVSRFRSGHGAASGPREAQDSRRERSLSRPHARRPARPR